MAPVTYKGAFNVHASVGAMESPNEETVCRQRKGLQEAKRKLVYGVQAPGTETTGKTLSAQGRTISPLSVISHKGTPS